jgi:hypothetical protein
MRIITDSSLSMSSSTVIATTILMIMWMEETAVVITEAMAMTVES